MPERDRANEIAERLVKVEHDAPGDRYFVTCHMLCGNGMSKHHAEEDAQQVRDYLAAALREMAAVAVQDAIRAALADVGDGEWPVSERDEAIIRGHAERLGAIIPRHDLNQSLALLDYERKRVAIRDAKILLLVTDDGRYAEGVERGRSEAAGQRAILCEALEAIAAWGGPAKYTKASNEPGRAIYGLGTCTEIAREALRRALR